MSKRRAQKGLVPESLEPLPNCAVVQYDSDQKLDFFDVKQMVAKGLLRNVKRGEDQIWRYEAKFW